MATLPTADEKARMVLKIFEHFNRRPGEVLLPGNFVVFAADKGWRNEDIADGVEHGGTLGWFKNGPNGTIQLTEAGYSEIGSV